MYSTPTGAASSITRHLNYLASLRPSSTWGDQYGFRVHRVAGVGNDAYWLDESFVGDPSFATLVFRQGNIVTLLSIGQDTAAQGPDTTSRSTVILARELTAWQRRNHSGSAATARVLELGVHPISVQR